MNDNNLKKFDNRSNENYEKTELGRTLSKNARIGGAIGTILTGLFFVYKGCRDLLSQRK